MKLDLVRRSEIENEHVVVAIVDQFVEPACHLGAPAAVKPTLEHRKLQPTAVAVHQFEHAASAPVIGNIIGDDIEPFLDHGAHRTR